MAPVNGLRDPEPPTNQAAATGASVRRPVAAGRFYPADPETCRRLAARLMDEAPGRPEATTTPWRGAIVPHAGWICSGAIAAESIRAVARHTPAVDVVVVFGAVHTATRITAAALDPHRRWDVPGGESEVSQAVGSKLVERSAADQLFLVDERLHRHEHAVEVELPFIQQAWPGAVLLPVEVPLTENAPEIGRRTAREIAAGGLRAVFLASSDLTHYGPGYHYAPAGVGPQGLAWAKDNDRRLLDVVSAMAVERVVPEVRAHDNACGGGAIAAMMAACRQLGATRGEVLRHANSCETLAAVAPQPPTDAVGYAAVVVG